MRNKDLVERYDKGERLKYVFFWGDKNNSGKVNKTCFSQWYTDSGDFEDEDFVYASCEHYMMIHKSLTMNPNDDYTVDKMLDAVTPDEVKKLGRKVKNFDPQKWDKRKFDIVVEGNYLKFSQDEELKEFLLNTGDRILVEASPYDKIWGIGLKQDAPNIENPNTWKGENLLGYALMEVRNKLKEE